MLCLGQIDCTSVKDSRSSGDKNCCDLIDEMLHVDAAAAERDVIKPVDAVESKDATLVQRSVLVTINDRKIAVTGLPLIVEIYIKKLQRRTD